MPLQVRYAKTADIRPMVQFAADLQEEQGLHLDMPVEPNDFGFWFANCIIYSGTYVFITEDDDGIQGIIVLNDHVCPWNNEYRLGIDLLFIARKGGLKLLRAAKKLKDKLGWYKLVLTSSSNRERTEVLYSKIANKVGGVYEL